MYSNARVTFNNMQGELVMDNEKDKKGLVNSEPGNEAEKSSATEANNDVTGVTENKDVSAPPVIDKPAGEKKKMSEKNKKTLAIVLPVIAVVIIAVAVIAVVITSNKNKLKPVVVTDENGVALTDVNGEYITVVPETEVVGVTDENGVPVTDSKGKEITTVVYKEVSVNVPVTDMNGSAVTDASGNVVTENINYTPTAPTGNGDTTKPLGTTAVPVTDGAGNTGVDGQGNLITTIVDITVPPTANIEPAKTEWKATLGGSENDYFSDVIVTKDGGYVAANAANSKDGNFKSFSDTGYIAPYTVLTKYDKEGNISWQKAVGSAKGITVLTSLVAAGDGGFYAAGYGKSLGGAKGYGYYDGFVYRFNSKGEQVWSKFFGTTTVDLFNDITLSSDGGVIVVGSVGTNNMDAAGFGGEEYKSRATIVKYSADGEMIWKNFVGGNMDTFTGVAEGADGSIFVVGNFYSGKLFKSLVSGKADSGVVKFSSEGKYLKIVPIAGTGIESFSGITASKDGGIIVVGSSDSSDVDNKNSFFSGDLASRGKKDAYIIKFDKNLSLKFATPFRGQNDDALIAVTEMSNGSLIAAGFTNSSSRDLKGVTTRGGDDMVIASFASDGELMWARSFGGTVADSASGICEASDGGYVVVGKSASNNVDLASISPYTGNGKTVGVIVKFPE